jgi:hypothetical protein
MDPDVTRPGDAYRRGLAPASDPPTATVRGATTAAFAPHPDPAMRRNS